MVILGQPEMQAAVCLLYQPIMTAECEAGKTEMLGATCRCAVLNITNVTWAALRKTEASVLGDLRLLYNPNCHYTKILDISLVFTSLLN